MTRLCPRVGWIGLPNATNCVWDPGLPHRFLWAGQIGFVLHICPASRAPAAPTHRAPPGELALFCAIRSLGFGRPPGIGFVSHDWFLRRPRLPIRRGQIGFVSHTRVPTCRPPDIPACPSLALFRIIAPPPSSPDPRPGEVIGFVSRHYTPPRHGQPAPCIGGARRMTPRPVWRASCGDWGASVWHTGS